MKSANRLKKTTPSFLISLFLSICTLNVSADVTIQKDVYLPNIPTSSTGDPVCIDNHKLVSNCEGAVGPPGPPGPGAGTFSKSIAAISCSAQGGATSGDVNNCAGGGTSRTDGDSNFPCMVRGGATRITYACHVDLPSGALIEGVTAYGWDTSTDGYFEAAIWRSQNTAFGINYFSPTFGGTWQNSGIAATPGLGASFPIYLDTDDPHTVEAEYRYIIGFAAKKTSGDIGVFGFRIDYIILP